MHFSTSVVAISAMVFIGISPWAHAVKPAEQLAVYTAQAGSEAPTPRRCGLVFAGVGTVHDECDETSSVYST